MAGSTKGQHLRPGLYVRHGKRLLDLCVSLPLAILLLPVAALIAILILALLGRPLFFVQSRPGLSERSFRLIKFRTMQNLGNRVCTLEDDNVRLTRFGRLLRSTSLDEIPELINVIKGEMSLVGPRPLLAKYLNLYTSVQRRRHSALPGITGWAQIHGRNELSWEERFQRDVWYVDNASLTLDLRILLSTIWKIILREGVTAKGQATVSEFQGQRETANQTANRNVESRE